MQVDPIKLNLKPPGTHRLKLNDDEPLSTSAFKFNLRCYRKAAALDTLRRTKMNITEGAAADLLARWLLRRRTPPTLDWIRELCPRVVCRSVHLS